jgi:hypothetical protein
MPTQNAAKTIPANKIIHGRRFFRAIKKITVPDIATSANSGQKTCEDVAPSPRPEAGSSIHAVAYELRAAIEAASTPPSATPLTQSGITQPLHRSLQSFQVWNTTTATMIRTKRAKSLSQASAALPQPREGHAHRMTNRRVLLPARREKAFVQQCGRWLWQSPGQTRVHRRTNRPPYLSPRQSVRRRIFSLADSLKSLGPNRTSEYHSR